MSNQPTERVQWLRSKAKAERELISNLNGSLSAAYLKQQLQNASNLLDDVEGFFFDEKILQEPRACRQLPATWPRADSSHRVSLIRNGGRDSFLTAKYTIPARRIL